MSSPQPTSRAGQESSLCTVTPVRRLLNRLRGLYAAIKAGDLSHYRYAITTRLKGLDLKGESVAALGLPVGRAHMHADSGGPELTAVLKSLALPRAAGAIDFGSGKGGAALTLASYFQFVLGVELSPALVDVAWSNSLKVGATNLHFLCIDAGRFTALDNYSVFYFFNPFPHEVMAEVFDNICASIARTPRPVWVIYKHPNSDALIRSRGFEMVRRFSPPNSHAFHVYYAFPST